MLQVPVDHLLKRRERDAMSTVSTKISFFIFKTVYFISSYSEKSQLTTPSCLELLYVCVYILVLKNSAYPDGAS